MATSAPKWSDLVQDERFQALDYDQKIKVREAHFQRTIAPHVRNEADMQTAWQRFSEAAHIDSDKGYLETRGKRAVGTWQQQGGGAIAAAGRSLEEDTPVSERQAEAVGQEVAGVAEGNVFQKAKNLLTLPGRAAGIIGGMAIAEGAETLADAVIPDDKKEAVTAEAVAVGEGLYDRGQEKLEDYPFDVQKQDSITSEPGQALGYYGTQAIDSFIGTMAPSLAVGMLTRGRVKGINKRRLEDGNLNLVNPALSTQAATLGTMGASVGGMEYEAAIRGGADHDEAMDQAIVRAMNETIPEVIPLGIAMKLMKGPLSKVFGKLGGYASAATHVVDGVVSEGASEVITEALNEYYDVAELGEEFNYEEFKTAAFDAFVVGALMGGIMTAPGAIGAFKEGAAPEPTPEDPGKKVDENPAGGGVNLQTGEFNYEAETTTSLDEAQPTVGVETGQPVDLNNPDVQIPETGTNVPDLGTEEAAATEDNAEVIKTESEDNVEVIEEESVALTEDQATELVDEAIRLEEESAVAAEAESEEMEADVDTAEGIVDAEEGVINPLIQDMETDEQFSAWLDNEVKPMEDHLKELRGETDAQKATEARKRAMKGSGEKKNALPGQDPHPARDNLLTLIAKAGGLDAKAWESEHGTDIKGEREKGGSNWVAGGSRQLFSQYKGAMTPDALAEWINQTGAKGYGITDEYLDLDGNIDATTVGNLVADMMNGNADNFGAPEFFAARDQAALIDRARTAYEDQWRTVKGIKEGDQDVLASDAEQEALPDSSYTEEEYAEAATEEEAIPAEGDALPTQETEKESQETEKESQETEKEAVSESDDLATLKARLKELQDVRALPFPEQRKVAERGGYDDYQTWRLMSGVEVDEFKARIRKLEQEERLGEQVEAVKAKEKKQAKADKAAKEKQAKADKKAQQAKDDAAEKARAEAKVAEELAAVEAETKAETERKAQAAKEEAEKEAKADAEREAMLAEQEEAVADVADVAADSTQPAIETRLQQTIDLLDVGAKGVAELALKLLKQGHTAIAIERLEQASAIAMQQQMPLSEVLDEIIDSTEALKKAQKQAAKEEKKTAKPTKDKAGKPTKGKLKNTGADLRRHWEHLQAELEAAKSDGEKIWATVDRNTQRARVLNLEPGKEATPGVKRYYEELAKNVFTFRKLIEDEWRFGRVRGSYATSFDKQMKRRLDGEYDDGATEWTPLLMDWAREYQTMLALFSTHMSGANTVEEAELKLAELIDTQQIPRSSWGDLVYLDAAMTVELTNQRYRSQSDIDNGLKTTVTIGPISNMDVRALLKNRKNQLGDAESGMDTTPITPFKLGALIKGQNDETDTTSRRKRMVRPRIEKIEREGKVIRKGDITPKQLKKEFGFADIGFGSWVAAGKDQQHMNAAWDAFYDLAETLGIDHQAIGFYGTLHFTVGALGHGKAAAHFQRSQAHPDGGTVPVVNLTNTKGDGTVSHEWGHAFDFLFMRETPGAKAVMKVIARELSKVRDINEMRKKVINGVEGRLVMRRSGKARSIENVQSLAEYYMKGWGSDSTQYQKNGNELGKDYWGSAVEMFARAFEAYVYDTMQGNELANNYLVSSWVAPDATTKDTYRGTPYPQGEERTRFNAIFDALISAISTESGALTIDEEVFTENLPDEIKNWDKDTQELYDSIPALVEAETAKREAEKAEKEKLSQQAEKDKWKAALEEAKAKQKLADDEKRAADEAKAAQAAADTGDIANTVDETKPLTETEADELFEQALSELQEELEGEGADQLGEASTPEGTPTQGIPWTTADLDAKQALADEGKDPDDKPPKGGKKSQGAKLAQAVKDSGVEGLGDIAKGLAELFPVNKLHSFPPTVDPDHYAKAKPYFTSALKKFQESGQNLLELVRWLIKTYGANIKPYVVYFIKDEGLSLDLKSTPEPAPAKTEEGSLANLMYNQIGSINDNNDLKRVLAEHHGRPATELEIKAGQEAFELALVVKAREIVANGREKNQSVLGIFNRLKAIYASQPNLNSRTSTSMAQQAYSTPMPLAFLASELAGINPGSSVYEPTAGNGALLIGASQVKSIVNELNPERADNLRSIGFLANEKDATTWTPPALHDAVIMNPPFGAHDNVKVDGYNLSKIDHVIAANALSALKDDGKGTIIIGAHKDTGKVDPATRIFLNWLYGNYDVVDHFEVKGDLYRKQGAGWPVKVITVHGRKLSNRVFDDTVERLDNWEEIYEHVKSVLDTTGLGRAGTDSSLDTGETAQDIGGTQTETGVLPTETGAEDGAGTGQGVRGEDGVSDSAGTESVSGDGDGAGASDTGTVSERPDDGGLQPTVDTAGETGGTKPGETTIVQGESVVGAALRTQPNLTVGSEYQTAYMTGSAGFNEDVLIPVNMASAVEATLIKLNAAVGDSDAYLEKKLGYKSRKALHKAFMALQVDAVASAIHTIETSGRGTIIADQTGVGKGRQAAAMIRYALRNDMVPVFVTVTPNLFTDMYDDLLDIDSTDVKPYIFNDEGGFIVDREGGPNKFRSTAKVRKEGQAALKAGKMPSGSNTLFMTYSQTNNYNAQQRTMLQGLRDSGKKVLFIFDESHTIAGDRKKWNSKAKEMRMTRAGFFFDLIKDQPVVYLSATYAKRPDNITIYYRTDLVDAVEEVDELEAAVGAGGEGLQTVMANMLAQSGQLWRRERSFAGIEFKSVVFGRDENGVVIPEKDAERQKHIQITNEATKGLREIVAVDRLFGDFVQEEGHRLLDVLPGAEGGVLSAGGTNADLALQHSLFASVVHNFVSQLLLSLKADWIVDSAIAQHEAGKKPVIALHNTMESFLLAEKERGNVELEGEWDGDYRSVLMAALERTRRITLEDKKGEKERIVVPMELLPLGIRTRYEAAERMIMALPIEEVTLFYIDYITNKLELAGLNVGEITGRKFIMDYSEGGNPILRNRPNRSKKFRRTIIDNFNNGTTDALIINAAGSTGLSIHASENFKNKDGSPQRPRHMLVAQAIPDINTLMQMFGRINRTGQTALPEYSMLGLDLPSEKRPLAMTARKMRSLNANTSANTESETSIDASEILNKYGDLVVKRIMIENPEFQVYSSFEVNDDTDPAGLATKITGKLSLAPYEIQEAAWELFLSEYQQHMEMLDSTGQNDLRVETQDLNAKIIDSKVIYEGKDPSTVFGGNTTLHKVSINLQGRAPSHLEVLQSVDDFLDGRSAEEVIQEISDATKLADIPRTEALTAATLEEINEGDKENESAIKAHQEQIAKARQTLQNHERDKRAFEQTLRRYPVGSAWKIDIGDDVVSGTIISVKSTHKEGGGNPYAPSKIQYRFMVNSPVRLFPIAMSGINRGTVIVEKLWVNPSNIENLYNSRAKSSRRETRYIATGNLISGYSRIGGTGKVTSFTAANGKAYTGILLPRKFGEGGEFATSDTDAVIMRDPAETTAYLRGTRNQHDLSRFGTFNMPDQEIRVYSAGNYGYQSGKWIIQAPKKRGPISQAIKFDPALLKLMDGDFAGRGQTMEAYFDDMHLEAVMKRVSEITTMYIPGSGFDALSNITGRTRTEATLSFDGGPNDESLREDYADADEGGLFENTEEAEPKFNTGSPFGFNEAGAGRSNPGRVTFLTKKLETVIARHSGKTIPPGTYTQVETPTEHTAAVSAVKRIFGKRVVFFHNAGGPRFNGVVLPNDKKTIYINVDSRNPFLGVLGHELLHSLRQSHPAVYETLARLARNHLKDQGLETFSVEHGGELDADKMYEEMMGNVVGDALLDPKFLSALKRESLSFFEKLIDALQSILKLFQKKILSSGMGTSTYFNDVETLIEQTQTVIRRADVRFPIDAVPEADVVDADSAPTYHRSSRVRSTANKEFMDRAGMSTDPVHLGVKIRNIFIDLKNYGAREMSDFIQQGMFDKFFGIKAAYRDYLGEDATTDAAGSGYVAARLSTGAASVMRGILLYGAPIWRNGIIQRMEGTHGLLDVFAPIKAELDDYLGWMIAVRAKRLYAEGKENNFTEEQIEAGLENAEGQIEIDGVMRDRLEVYEEVAEDFNNFKTTILDVAEGAGLIDGTTRPVWENPDWIPFYRINDNKSYKGPQKGLGLSHQSSGIKKLFGGKDKLNDPMGNIVMNFAHLIEASMKNAAMLKTIEDLSETEAVSKSRIPMQQAIIVKSDMPRLLRADGVDEATIQQMEEDGSFEGLAKMWSLSQKTPEGMAKVMVNGKAQYWKINDPKLLKSLLQVDVDPLPKFMAIFRAPKTLLTMSITADPGFMLRNFTRDAFHAWAINEDHFTAGVASVKGLAKSWKEDGGMLDMMFAGGSFQGGYINGTDPQAARKSVRVAMRQKGYSNEYVQAHVDTVVDTTAGIWDRWRRVGDAFENANREAVYEAATKAGKSKARAVYEAKDLMDFSMQGQWQLMRYLADMLPFFNARLQGLYKLGRSGSLPGPGWKWAIFRRGLVMAGFSMALAWLNSDDEDYEALEDWDKDTYWHFFPGTAMHVRVPKPFEIGLIYGTLPERLFRSFTGKDTAGKSGSRLWHGITDTLALDFTPQTFRPWIEIYSNKNAFTGRPIESMTDRNKMKRSRYSTSTSDALVAMGPIFEMLNLSPKQAESLWRGYTGTLGNYTLMATDILVRDIQGKPPVPASTIRELPVVGSFVRGSGPAWNTRYGTEMYELHREVTELWGSIKGYQKEGLMDEAKELYRDEDNKEMLRTRGTLKQWVKNRSVLRKEIDRIYRHKEYSAAEKQDRIGKILERRNKMDAKTYKYVSPMFGKK